MNKKYQKPAEHTLSSTITGHIEIKPRFFETYRTDIFLIIGLIFAGVFAAHSFLQAGHPVMGDVWPHLARTKMFYEMLVAGEWPMWSYKLYYGYPFMQFYGPLYFAISACVTIFFGGDCLLATKVLLFTLHAISGVAVYLFVARFSKNKYAGFIGGLAYLFTFWHLFHVLYMGRYPVALLYVLIPLAFWLEIRFLDKPGIRRAILSATALSMVLLTHPIYGLFTFLFAAVLALPHVARLFKTPGFWKIAVTFACSGFATSGFFIVPFFLEGLHFKAPPEETMNLVGVNLMALLTWSKSITPLGSWQMGSYLGLSVWGLALLGVVNIIKRKEWTKVTIIAGLCITAFLIFGFQIPWYRDNFFKMVGGFIPKRFLVFFIVFLAFLSGEGFLFILTYVKKARYAVLIAVACILADLAPTSFQKVFPNAYDVIGGRQEIYSAIEAQQGTDKICADLDKLGNEDYPYGRVIRYPGMQMLYTRNPSPFGFFGQFAPPSSRYVYPWMKLVSEDLAATDSTGISQRSRDILWLLGLNYLIMYPPTTTTPQGQQLWLKQGLTWYPYGIRNPRVPAISAVVPFVKKALVSDTLMPYSTTSIHANIATDYELFLKKITIDTSRAALAQIPTRGISSPVFSGSIGSALIGKPTLTFHHTRVEGSVSVNNPCFVRLPVSCAPNQRITINKKVSSYYETGDHFIAVRAEKGLNTITISSHVSNLRKAFNVVSIGLLALLAVLWWKCPEKKDVD